jgi:hypothetical protein
VSPVKYELGCYIPEDDILHSDRRGNLKSYRDVFRFTNALAPQTVLGFSQVHVHLVFIV